MRKITGRNLLLTLLIGLVLVAFNALWAWRNISRVVNNNERAVESRQTIGTIRRVLSVMKDAETGQRGYVITQVPDYLVPYEQARRDISLRLNQLRHALYQRPDVDQARDYEALQKTVAAKFTEMQAVLDDLRIKGVEPARSRVQGGQGKRLMDRIRALATNMEGREEKILKERDDQTDKSIRYAKFTFGAATTLSTLLLLSVYWLVKRDLRERAAHERHLISSRDEAQGQKAEAESQRAEAERQREAAERQKDEAQHQREAAETERQRAEHQFHLAEEARDQAQQEREVAETANRAKSDFIAGISHELRTPLNAIIGFSKLLQNPRVGPLNEDQREYVSDVVGSSEHLLQLINDLLDISKIEAGKLRLDREEFALAETLEGSMGVIRERAKAHNIALKLDVAPAIKDLEPVEADRRKVRQILFNLLSNAVKFTPDGGQITLSADLHMTNEDEEPVAPYAEICVRDTGIGISPENLQKIWGAFEQVDGSYTRKQQGTGLGLTLTKRMVELHGGEISAESQEGQGSLFRFTLPLETSQAPTASIPVIGSA